MNHFKVKSKEESSQKHLRPSPTLAAPLASTESLTPSESTTGSSTIKRISSSVTGDSVSTVVHKPYEPPTLGKSSRDLYYKLSYALTFMVMKIMVLLYVVQDLSRLWQVSTNQCDQIRRNFATFAKK